MDTVGASMLLDSVMIQEGFMLEGLETLLMENKVQILSEHYVRMFEQRCLESGINDSNSILPYYYSGENFCSMMDFLTKQLLEAI